MTSEFAVPDGLRYAESHEWARRDDDVVRVGITDFAQDELGDIVFVELPSIRTTVDQGEDFGIVESIKAVSDMYAPIAGEVVSVNDELIDRPELVNTDPYEGGWMIEIRTDDTVDDLLSAAAYRNQI